MVVNVDQQSRSEEPYRLLLLDMMMPEMDGFELAKRIRMNADFRDCSLIMISSAMRPGDADLCRELGVERYMTKPVMQSDWRQTILDVVVANNGSEAVAAMGRQSFDVVLMDVQMPEMDGLEATRVIRNKERLSGKHTPIIAMTASAMKGDRSRCLDAGMDSYLSKPIDPQLLWKVIEDFSVSIDTETAAELNSE